MKKITFLLSFFVTFSVFSQGTEDFTNSNATASYLDGSFVGNSSITWTYVHSRNGNGDQNNSGINLPALMLRQSSSDSKITSSTISGGIANFSVKLYKGFTGGGDREVELFINGVSKGTSTPFDDFNEHIFSVSGINISGNIIIEIRNIRSKQVIVDDITWTAYSNDLTVSSDQTISSAVSYDNVTVDSGQTLTIAKTGSLTISGNLTNNGTVTLNSDSANYSSLIVQGSSTGNITYKRHVADEGTDEWDFIGSPVIGQDLQNLIDNNSTLATNGSQVAIGVFNNNAGSDNAAAMYTNYNTTGNSGTTLVSGQGFAMATDEGSTTATVDFTGTINTSDVSFAIDDASSSNTNYGKFNLVANPFPSFLNANDDAHASNNFLTVNASDLHTSYAAIYAYDGDGTFTAINHTDPGSAVYIAPGQGFFVASDDASGDSVSFTEAMQTSSGSDDFISGDNMNVTEVLIKLFNGDNELETTKLYFEEGLSIGLDVGYDAGNFHAEAPIMTRLVEEDEGYGMVINAMGLDAMENAVIPLVINQSAGQEFRVNLHTATIPDPNVYLEDVEEGTFTNLYEGDFVYTPTSDLEGAGRFFIHMSADTMSNDEVSTSMLNAYKEINANYITLEGLATQSNNINVSLYNILGRKVLDTSLNNNVNTQTISTLGMATGIYVIELESGNDRLTKKLIIQ